MAGDFSRTTLNPLKHYSGVLMQQGRVQVDADWNEQLALQLHRTYAETRDIIGRCGTPRSGDGFRISESKGGGDLLIHAGHFYVNGLLCELEPQRMPVSLPQLPSPPSSPTNVQFQMRAGESLGSFERQLELMRTKNIAFKKKAATSNADGQVNLPSLWLDDRELAVGDCVEVSASGYGAVAAIVTNISGNTLDDDSNSITPNYYIITLNASLAKLTSATELWLQRVVTFTTQPFLHNQWDAALEISPLSGPSGAELNLSDGDYLVVLEAWQREVNALEDPHIREVALGGPDTCERLQTVWQVHVVPYGGETSPPDSPISLSPPSPLNCCSDFPGWDTYKASIRTTGLMNALAPPPGNNVCPCELPPSAGYLGLTNQLYRVEVFQPGEYNDSATIVWSRDNAMVEAPIVCIDAQGIVYINSLGTDDLHSFSQNNWVEIVDDTADLQGQPRFLAQISQAPGTSAQPPCAPGAPQAFTLTLTPPAPSRFQGKSNLRLRRWDMPQSPNMLLDGAGNPLGIPIVPGWVQLENNIEVNFTEGFYASRSYWQIPARTATGDIEWPPFQVPNTNPIPQPPLGVEHSFCRLALIVVTDGKWKITDCRCTFPSLTNICASDICYRGTGCELESVATVQQALDELDAKNRFHNKMLHGSGVVCGLGVSCPGENLTGTSVNIAAGYAIDCEGYDLIVDQATTLDLATIVDLSPQQGAIPDGDYELILDRADSSPAARVLQQVDASSSNGESCCSKISQGGRSVNSCVTFRAVACATESLTQEALNGTLLSDFYNKCIKRLLDNFKARYEDEYLSSAKQVSQAQALTSSLTNLLIQLFQPSLTSDVYISRKEAEILEEFYLWLSGQLRDRTFCSLLANLRPYPEYALGSAAEMETIFGKGFKTRLRVGPAGTHAYTVGVNADIHVYDLTTGLLASVITPPIPGDATGWTVQDIAFSANGEDIYAIATGVNSVTNASDSLFAVGVVDNFSVTWKNQGSAGARSFSTLATLTDSDEAVYAVVPGQGLFAIGFGDGVAVDQLAQFNAVGHLVTLQRFFYATANSGSAAGGSFDEVLQLGLNASAGPIVYQLNGVAGNLTDDIAVYEFQAPGMDKTPLLSVTAAASSTADKQLFFYRAGSDATKQIASVDLGENTTTRLAFNPVSEALMITFEDSCRIKQVTETPNGFTLSTYAPVELHPMGIAFSQRSASENVVYVLNSTANTISRIPEAMPQFDAYQALENYRSKALDAFIDLAGALLQNLKDCFCDLLLPSCPSCDLQTPEGIGVALACVTVRNGLVYKICNLEKRKYVKTFPTIGYWLSLVPIIPFVKTLVGRFCCLVVSDIASKYSAPESSNATFAGVTGESVRYTVAKVSNLRVADLQSATLQKAAPVGKLALDAVFSPFKRSSTSSTVKVNQITGMSLDQAKASLTAAKVNVAATEVYDPSAFAKNAVGYASAPASLQPGSSVTLVVDSNQQVRYYVQTPPVVDQISSTVQDNQTEVEKQVAGVTQLDQQLQDRIGAVEKAEAPALEQVQGLQNLVSSLQSQMSTMATTQAKELAARDQQIAQLMATAQQMQTKLGTLDDLANQVKGIEGRLPPVAPK